MAQPFQDRFPQLVVQPGLDGADPGRWPWQVSVKTTAGGTVLAGEVAVAFALIEAAQAANPTMVEATLARWADAGRAADDADDAWRRGYEAALRACPVIAYALETSPDRLMERAGLDAGQRQLLNLHLDAQGPRAIGRVLGLGESTVRARLECCLRQLRQLAAEESRPEETEDEEVAS